MKRLLKNFCALALTCGLAISYGALQVNQLAGFGAYHATTGGGGSGFDPETDTWISRVNAAGGSYGADSKSIADALIIALKAKSYNSKIVYLLPLLGSNLAAARVPLRDSLGVGIATNTSFVDADFSQSTGLQGNGSSKILNSLIKPSQLGTSGNCGLGYWETNISLGGHVEPIGCYWNTDGSQRFVIDLRSSVRAARLGFFTTSAGDTSTPTNGDYYGQRSSSTDLRLFIGGSKIATTTTSNSASGNSDNTIGIVGSHGSFADGPWPGRCAVAYMTDGTLSDADVADFHSFLGTYLITPTGR